MMGFSPAVIRRMTFPEFRAAFDGFRQFHGGKDDTPPVEPDEYFRILAEEMDAGRATRH